MSSEHSKGRLIAVDDPGSDCPECAEEIGLEYKILKIAGETGGIALVFHDTDEAEITKQFLESWNACDGIEDPEKTVGEMIYFIKAISTTYSIENDREWPEGNIGIQTVLRGYANCARALLSHIKKGE